MSWLFTVEEFHRVSPQVASFMLRPIEPGPGFPESCTMLSVASRFEREPFWRLPWNRRNAAFTEARHLAALDELEHAAKDHRSIRFGSMGTGLAPVAGDPCVTHSRGLAVLEDMSPEGRAVYSFHDPY